MVWLFLLLFLDLILLGVMIPGARSPRGRRHAGAWPAAAVFRTATWRCFDPQLIVLGPAACVILDLFGVAGCKIFALACPATLGLLQFYHRLSDIHRGDLEKFVCLGLPFWGVDRNNDENAIVGARCSSPLNDLDDKPVALQALPGQTIIVNFWAR